jgi:DNA-binding MarR family transcriptional regulator
MHAVQLPEDYALVLQQVDVVGEEDFLGLAESLCLDQSRLSHIVQALRNKGLLRVRYSAQDTWISLSSKGHRLISSLWPEARRHYSY